MVFFNTSSLFTPLSSVICDDARLMFYVGWVLGFFPNSSACLSLYQALLMQDAGVGVGWGGGCSTQHVQLVYPFTCFIPSFEVPFVMMQDVQTIYPLSDQFISLFIFA